MSDTVLARDVQPGMTLVRKGDSEAVVIAVARVKGPPERIILTIQSTLRYPLNMPVAVKR